jgi:hypothetical protein
MEIQFDDCCSTVGLLAVSQIGLEPMSGVPGTLLFSHCNMAWTSFVQAGVQGVDVLILLIAFFSARCGSHISVRFLIY